MNVHMTEMDKKRHGKIFQADSYYCTFTSLRLKSGCFSLSNVNTIPTCLDFSATKIIRAT